jgi:hypothetical protein
MSRWSAASPPRCTCRAATATTSTRKHGSESCKAIRDWDPERRVPFRNFAWLCAVRESRMAVNAARARKHQPLNGARPLHLVDADGPSLQETVEATGRPDDDPVAKTLGRDTCGASSTASRRSPISSAAPSCWPPATARAARPPLSWGWASARSTTRCNARARSSPSPRLADDRRRQKTNKGACAASLADR